MTYRTLLPVAAAIGVSVSIVGCGRGAKTVQVTVTPAGPGRGGSPPARACPGPGPDCRPDCRVAAPFCRRRAGAQPRPPRAGADVLRSRRRRAAEVAQWRPDRATHPQPLRSARRAHQRVRDHGALAGRRIRREKDRAGVDRQAARDFHVRSAGADHGHRDGGRERSQPDQPRRRHPAEPQGPFLHRVVSGKPARFHQRRLAARRQISCR